MRRAEAAGAFRVFIIRSTGPWRDVSSSKTIRRHVLGAARVARARPGEAGAARGSRVLSLGAVRHVRGTRSLVPPVAGSTFCQIAMRLYFLAVM